MEVWATLSSSGNVMCHFLFRNRDEGLSAHESYEVPIKKVSFFKETYFFGKKNCVSSAIVKLKMCRGNVILEYWIVRF